MMTMLWGMMSRHTFGWTWDRVGKGNKLRSVSCNIQNEKTICKLKRRDAFSRVLWDGLHLNDTGARVVSNEVVKWLDGLAPHEK
jgi:lysophospholipase L1-like esterase